MGFRRWNHNGSLTARVTWIPEGDAPQIFLLIDTFIGEYGARGGNRRMPGARPGARYASGNPPEAETRQSAAKPARLDEKTISRPSKAHDGGPKIRR